ncbi:MAG: hypothetical protein HY855_16130 [Burkholderiales bacterium]|nr:hypothetical protein [Burkholderiales bacterium]
MKRWFHRVVLRRLWLSFVVMVLSFFAFGIGSLNLFYLLRANANLLLDHGWQAVMDGGLAQLAELLFSGFAAMAAYIVFKTCEHRLVHWLGEPNERH